MAEAKAFIKKTLHFAMDPFLTKATIEEVVQLNSSFTLIKMKCLGLKELKWNPGDKMQIEIGDFKDRSYTPFEVDTNHQTLKILGFKRDRSPASDWLKKVKAGDACDFFGPRASLAVPEKNSSIAIFGDETTLGLIRAIQTEVTEALAFIEGSQILDVQAAISELKIAVDVTAVLPDDSNLVKMAEKFIQLYTKNNQTKFILAGRAKSIQTLRSLMTKGSIPSSQIKTKVYWADGKVGLD